MMTGMDDFKEGLTDVKGQLFSIQSDLSKVDSGFYAKAERAISMREELAQIDRAQRKLETC